MQQYHVTVCTKAGDFLTKLLLCISKDIKCKNIYCKKPETISAITATSDLFRQFHIMNFRKKDINNME